MEQIGNLVSFFHVAPEALFVGQGRVAQLALAGFSLLVHQPDVVVEDLAWKWRDLKMIRKLFKLFKLKKTLPKAT